MTCDTDRIQNGIQPPRTNSRHSYFTDELIGVWPSNELMDKLDYTESQASNLFTPAGFQIYNYPGSGPAGHCRDEEINNPDNYSVAKYSRGVRAFHHHADGNHRALFRRKPAHLPVRAYWEIPPLRDSYASKEAVQDDIDQYKAWLLKDGDEIIGERQNLILQPQASFVLLDQHTGEVKALCGGRG